MAKTETYFICSDCGHRQLKWSGRCSQCGQWSTFEEKQTKFTPDTHRPQMPLEDEKPLRLNEILKKGNEPAGRLVSGLDELDRVFGGGLVSGSTVLVGGPPGIGKSTLVLHLAGSLAGARQEVLYVTSEESSQQIAMRAKRLNINDKSIRIAPQTNLEIILNYIKEYKPKVVMIDSIQLIYKPENSSPPGSVSQMRQCTTELVWLAKATGTAVILVGHVTKKGMIAGPKILEHIVDVVLHFEGDRNHIYRVIRAVKNRFGTANELGVFEMTEKGLLEISDPSAAFLSDNYPVRPGRVTLAAGEGARILLVEVQALTAPGIPGMLKRKGTGIESKRLGMLLAVLEKHAGVNLAGQDVYVNVVGGVRVNEPAADLAVAMAIAGANKNAVLPADTLVFGEVGLLGEVRPVSLNSQRITEAVRHGFKRIFAPADNAPAGKTVKRNVEIHNPKHLQQALEVLQ